MTKDQSVIISDAITECAADIQTAEGALGLLAQTLIGDMSTFNEWSTVDMTIEHIKAIRIKLNNISVECR